MKSSSKIIILSLPRSGSSFLTNLIKSSGYQVYSSKNSHLLGSSNFNTDGYFEDNVLTLLNDQIIRIVFGNQYSFLYVPSIDVVEQKPNSIKDLKDYSYDLDDDTIFIPDNYEENIKEYTGSDYDIWALTRMLKGRKWNKCYSKNNVDTYDNIIKKIKDISNDFNDRSYSTIMKDPRLALTFPYFIFSENTKFIFLTREKTHCINSMRKHYGKNLFTNKYLPNTNMCSNYFNYKIKYQSSDYYYETFNAIIKKHLTNKSFISITYEQLIRKDVSLLEDFIESKINMNIVGKNV